MERYFKKFFNFFIVLAILLQAGACKRQGNPSADAQKPRNIRLLVGKIREVRLPLPADTSLQVVASSENNEIVDVSKQTTEQPTGTRPTAEVFLIKGVTPGTVKVTFARKKVDEEGPGDITQTYQVRVVNR